MLRITLLVGLTAMTGSTATVTPTAPTKAPAAATPSAQKAPAAGLTVAEKAQAANVSWMGRYGYYNPKQGAWDLVPSPNSGKGC